MNLPESIQLLYDQDKIFDNNEVCLLIIRPDQYIGLCCHELKKENITDYFEHKLGYMPI